jgi:hypothetical protein
VRLDDAAAADYARLHASLQPLLVPQGRYVMAFDEIPGVVLAMDGRPVGEAWYSRLDPVRTARNLRAVCADGPPWHSRLPLIVFDRPVTAVETSALAACQLSLDRDYVLAHLDVAGAGLAIYLPTGDQATAHVLHQLGSTP